MIIKEQISYDGVDNKTRPSVSDLYKYWSTKTSDYIVDTILNYEFGYTDNSSDERLSRRIELAYNSKDSLLKTLVDHILENRY